jgi:hypothetical protein
MFTFEWLFLAPGCFGTQGTGEQQFSKQSEEWQEPE